MTPYIKFNQLNMKSIKGSSISFTANKGDIIGITGANGSGKSCLASYIAGLTRPDSLGKVIVAGYDSLGYGHALHPVFHFSQLLKVK